MDLVLKNQVVEVMEGTGEVLSYYPFNEEISFTEWLGGLIVVSAYCPVVSGDGIDDKLGIHVDDGKDKRSISSLEPGDILLKAYHVSRFNVDAMLATDGSRVAMLR